MSVRMVAILSPGDMGHAVGWALGDHGLDVITCLRGRSERTSGLARAGNIRDVADLGQLVSEADLVLSIIPPAQAVGVARQVAEAIRSARANTFFADCNAVSPETTRSIAGIIDEAGGRFMDASIIGSPPGRGAAHHSQLGCLVHHFRCDLGSRPHNDSLGIGQQFIGKSTRNEDHIQFRLRLKTGYSLGRYIITNKYLH